MRRDDISNFKPAPKSDFIPEPKSDPIPVPPATKANFIGITSLYPSKTGSSFTVFVNDKIIDTLSRLEANDLLGVSPNKFGGYSLWVKPVVKTGGRNE